MSNDLTPRGKSDPRKTDRADAIERLRAAIDAAIGVGAQAPPFSDPPLGGPDDALPPEITSAPLSPDALEMLITLLPNKVVSDRTMAIIHRQQLRAYRIALYEREAEANCPANSPGELFQQLRERASVTLHRAATALRIPEETLREIETMRTPWHTIAPDALLSFAEVVELKPPVLVAYLQVAAKRSILCGIEKRAGHALGRFDAAQNQSGPQRDTLRLAFARMADENEKALRFFDRAWNAVDVLTV